MKDKKPSSVRATPEVANFISNLKKGGYLEKIIDKALERLDGDIGAGNKVEKKKIPKYYFKKYGIYNLYVMDLDSSRRATYTLVFDGVGVSVNILEIFTDHKQYERRFGYG